MDLDALLRHYFGTDAPDALGEQAIAEGLERLRIDFGVEREASRKFALWTLLAAFDAAPLPADAFEDEPALRRAADDYLSLAWKLEG